MQTRNMSGMLFEADRGWDTFCFNIHLTLNLRLQSEMIPQKGFQCLRIMCLSKIGLCLQMDDYDRVKGFRFNTWEVNSDQDVSPDFHYLQKISQTCVQEQDGGVILTMVRLENMLLFWKVAFNFPSVNQRRNLEKRFTKHFFSTKIR